MMPLWTPFHFLSRNRARNVNGLHESSMQLSNVGQ